MIRVMFESRAFGCALRTLRKAGIAQLVLINLNSQEKCVLSPGLSGRATGEHANQKKQCRRLGHG